MARWNYAPIRGVSNNYSYYNIEFPSEILSGNEQQITVKLKCNRPWTIKPFDSYVTFNDGEDTISGVGNQDIIFNISQNNDNLYTRTLDFTITYGFTHEEYSEDFFIEQDAYLEDTIDEIMTKTRVELTAEETAAITDAAAAKLPAATWAMKLGIFTLTGHAATQRGFLQ